MAVTCLHRRIAHVAGNDAARRFSQIRPMNINQIKQIKESVATVPICVDLDGTLLVTDSIFISLSRCLRQSPFRTASLLSSVFFGKAAFKTRLHELACLTAKDLPYRTDLIEWLRHKKHAGCEIYLTTGAPMELAAKVASHLDLFCGVISSSATENLVGIRKHDALVARFGHAGFDYIGDSKSDIVVWKSARMSYVVGSKINPSSVEEVLNLTHDKFRFESNFLVWSRALRFHQWTKNLLVCVPLFASHRWGELGLWLSTGIAFVSWCLLSSAGYIINDLLDIEDDCKRNATAKRPLAAGRLEPAGVICMIPILLILGTLGASTLGAPFTGVAMGYFTCSVTYTFYFKRLPIADIIVLAILYIIRIIGGGVATGIKPSVWLLMFSLFAFCSLAFLKRFSELRRSSTNAVAHGRAYHFDHQVMLSQMGISCATCSILVIALYVQSPEVLKVYPSPTVLLITCPLTLYGLARLWHIGWTGKMDYDPIVTCLRDRPTRLVALAIVVAVVLACR